MRVRSNYRKGSRTGFTEPGYSGKQTALLAILRISVHQRPSAAGSANRQNGSIQSSAFLPFVPFCRLSSVVRPPRKKAFVIAAQWHSAFRLPDSVRPADQAGNAPIHP